VAIAAKMWLVRPISFSLDDYYLRRAGLDYWDELEWEAVDDWQAICSRLDEAKAGRKWLFSARATRSYTDVAYTKGDVLVFGSESAGLPAEIKAAHADSLLTIPSRPHVRSLNVANSAAIVAYEALRQWR
jgi:tRNA (cytidine/uridine-2'-O-)-methyltransferase